MLPGIALAALWIVSFVLATGESALTYASRTRLEELIELPGTRDRYIAYLERSTPTWLLCVLGRVAAEVAFFFMVLLGEVVGDGPVPHFAMSALIVGTAIAAAELLGRLAGRKASTPALLALLPILHWVALPLRPLTSAWMATFGADGNGHKNEVVQAAKEEIRVAIEDAVDEGAIEPSEKDMIEGVLEFRDVEVSEIMTPRTEIECLDADTPIAEAVRQMQNSHHSRIPVIRETRDDVAGIVHVKDMLSVSDDPSLAKRPLAELVRDAFFIPETKHVGSLLRDFRQRHEQLAIILDEYGGVTGLVTIEGIMEEIVGEIEDEFDDEDHAARIRNVSPGVLDVDARVHVDEINDALDADLPEDEDYDTIGGFVMDQLARVPERGEEIRYHSVLVQVLESDNQRVRRVLVKKIEPEDGAG